MHYEKSCGALVLRRGADGGVYILMIRHKHGGHRSFPKGHMERGETEYMTAVREVYEETSVQIRINTKFRETVRYSPLPGVSKEVVYFLTTTEQERIRPQEGEIAEVEWVPVEEAEASLTHENDKTVFRAAMKTVREQNVFSQKAATKRDNARTDQGGCKKAKPAAETFPKPSHIVKQNRFCGEGGRKHEAVGH